MKLDDDSDPRIDTVFRNGTLTTIGIVLSFSLGFLAKWGENPLPWQVSDIPSVAAFCIGIGLQFRALALLLDADSLRRAVFTKATRFFLYGAMTTALGIVLAIVTDLLKNPVP